MQDAHLGGALVDHLLGEVRQIGHRELALFDLCRQALDEGFVLADLAQHVLVIEHHADLGILGDAVDLALELRRVPQHRDHVGEGPGVLLDEVLKVHGVAGLGELADPFVRGDVDVRALVHREGLEDVEGVGIVAVRRPFLHHHLDRLVRARRLQGGVERFGRRDDVAGPQRTCAVGPRPQFTTTSSAVAAGTVPTSAVPATRAAASKRG